MTNALTVPAINDWIAATLKGDATLTSLVPGGVHRGVAPLGTAGPWIAFSNLSAITKLVVGGRKLNTEALFLVRGVDHRENYSALIAIANQIDTLLHNAPPQAIPGGQLNDCVNDSEFEREDPPIAGTSVIYTHLGARYKIHAQAP